MAKAEGRPIIVRKVVKAAEAHHGGAWKVAYADFVTAMMAFFLLMWLLSASSEEQRRGIADYFDPTVPISQGDPGGAGVLSGESVFSDATMAGMKDRGVMRRPFDPLPTPNAERNTFADPKEGEDLVVPRGAFASVATDVERDAPAGRDSAADAPAGRDSAADAEAARAEALEAEFAELLESMDDGTLREHIEVQVTPEGLSIEIVDLIDDPLFEDGSATPSPILGRLLEILVPLLRETTNALAVVGHTDGRPFHPGATYTNWELSSDRANSARRAMTRLGLEADRISRVSGVEATRPFDPDPASPRNRRISIVLLHEGWR